jgi:hypothetical protein
MLQLFFSKICYPVHRTRRNPWFSGLVSVAAPSVVGVYIAVIAVTCYRPDVTLARIEHALAVQKCCPPLVMIATLFPRLCCINGGRIESAALGSAD